MKSIISKYQQHTVIGSEHQESCAACGRRFNLRQVRLDGDGQFRCAQHSFGPSPQSIAEANVLLADYLARQPALVAKIQRLTQPAARLLKTA